jgi:hypothetical protein
MPVEQIVEVPGNVSPLERERCDRLVEHLRRVAQAEGGGEAPRAESAASLPAALVRLGERGLLSFQPDPPDGDEVVVFYTPSRPANLRVAGPETDGFPEPVDKKQRQALRQRQGALFRFPAEEGSGVLEVFITDWSPSPVACAVAVHRWHPIVDGLEKPRGSFFSGKFVRHPLTGDLLPVWVADWVRPDFGTGAVLVNPAHDPTDLQFARATGMPIRFGLVPDGFDGSPETWPAPPLVKTGKSIKTGPYDGLSVSEAMERYFAVLQERGLAETYQDCQAGRWPLARLVPDAEGGLEWDGGRDRLTAAGVSSGSGVRVRLEGADLLEAALRVDFKTPPTLVCPAAELTGALLFLRLLLFDLNGEPLSAGRVLLVQKVQDSGGIDDPDLRRLALLVGAPLGEAAVLKQQVLEQAKRFLRVHGELLQSAAAAEAEEASPAKALQQVKAALLEGNPAKAYALLQPVQKQLAANGGRGAMAEYFALAGVLAGLEVPAGLETAVIWRRL